MENDINLQVSCRGGKTLYLLSGILVPLFDWCDREAEQRQMCALILRILGFDVIVLEMFVTPGSSLKENHLLVYWENYCKKKQASK